MKLALIITLCCVGGLLLIFGIALLARFCKSVYGKKDKVENNSAEGVESLPVEKTAEESAVEETAEAVVEEQNEEVKDEESVVEEKKEEGDEQIIVVDADPTPANVSNFTEEEIVIGDLDEKIEEVNLIEPEPEKEPDAVTIEAVKEVDPKVRVVTRVIPADENVKKIRVIKKVIIKKVPAPAVAPVAAVAATAVVSKPTPKPAPVVKEEPKSSGSFGQRIPFAEKMLLAEKKVQGYYDTINNEFNSFRQMHARVSVAGVSYRFGRDLVAKITYRGKTMKLHLALKIKDYDENIYFQQDMKSVKAYKEVPFTVKVKSDRGLKNALVLVNEMCNKHGIEKKTRYQTIDSIEPLKEWIKK